MMPLELSIYVPEDLDKIGRWPRLHLRRIKVTASITGTQHTQLDRLTAAINRDLRACGCGEGAALCAVAIAGLPLVGPLLSSWLSLNKPTLWCLGFIYLLTAALLGKIAGIIWAEYRLARNVHRLKNLLVFITPKDDAVLDNQMLK